MVKWIAFEENSRASEMQFPAFLRILAKKFARTIESISFLVAWFSFTEAAG